MKTYANQKMVEVVKAISDKDNYYGIFNKRCALKAIHDLTYNEYKVYTYINLNQDGHKFALSPEDISKQTGANKRRVEDAINGLIKKGYLVNSGMNNLYIFREDIEEGVQTEEDIINEYKAYLEQRGFQVVQTVPKDVQTVHTIGTICAENGTNCSEKYYNNTYYNTISTSSSSEEEVFELSLPFN